MKVRSEARLAYLRAWRRSEAGQAYMRSWRKAHAKEVAAYRKRWANAHPKKAAAQRRTVRAEARRRKKALVDEARTECVDCGAPSEHMHHEDPAAKLFKVSRPRGFAKTAE